MEIEPRWPVVLTSTVVLVLLSLLPDRIKVVPIWAPWLLALALIIPMAVLAVTSAKSRWLHIETVVTAIYLFISGFGIVVALTFVLSTVVRHSAEVTGLQLLTSSVAVWVTNVGTFSVAYWRLDRGGPEARANSAVTKPDWLFPQDSARDVLPDWHATFVDYLFLAFCTATAFSPTDALPVTPRAKLLMMSESVISLVTIIAVAARAINILGS